MSTADKEADPISVDKLYAIQYDRTETLNQWHKNFKKDSTSRKTNAYCQIRLEKVECLYTEFTSTHEQLVYGDDERSSKYFSTHLSTQFEDTYFELRCGLLEILKDIKSNTVTLESDPVNIIKPISPIKMPKLPLPSFSGKFIDWPAFHDAFVRLVHSNEDLNLIQKFHFLKEALPTSSDSDIRQMALSETNYPIAWDLITKRYDNPRLLFMHHMNKLFSLPPLIKENADDIKSLLNASKVCINEFQRLGISISQCDQWVAYYIATKLPKDTHQAWEHHLGSSTVIPKFEALETFLNNRLVTINVIENRTITHDTAISSKQSHLDKHTFSRNSHQRHENQIRKKSFFVATKSHNAVVCPLCKCAHILRRCPTFLSKTCFDRKTIVDQNRHCLNCLSPAHSVSKCTSTKNCIQCGQRHHTLLHFPQKNNLLSSTQCDESISNLNPATPIFQPVNTTTFHSNTPVSTLTTHTAHFVPEKETVYPTQKVLLATSLVWLINDHTGQRIQAKALIDQGSEGTLISEAVVQTLSLPRARTLAEISGVGNIAVNQCKFVVRLTIASCINSAIHVPVNNAYVLKKLTTTLPTQAITPQTWRHIKDLPLADPLYYKQEKIDLIIGADLLASILLPEMRIGDIDEPIAQNTRLGWILSGNTVSKRAINIRCHHATLQLESLVQRLYETEQVPHAYQLTDEDSWCENHFKQTHCRQANGKFLVRLPLKCIFDETKTIGYSRQAALKRFYSLERKFDHSDEFKKCYHEGIQEYFSLNQIVAIQNHESKSRKMLTKDKPKITSCVLPHHAVQKSDSITTKFRIVFDASCQTSNGRSLNDILCVGPKLQNELPAVIMNWRKHKYAFTSDIQKMYRCIDMHPEDAQYQRILWRDENNIIQEYCLTTVTFGTASAPFTAIKVLHQLAEDVKGTHPLATSVLKNEIYVDDVFSGSDSLHVAKEIRNQLIAALQSAGMELRKWSSNSKPLIQDIPKEHLSNQNQFDITNNETIKTLGIYWQPNEDHFTFKLNFQIDQPYTKRSVLATIAKLYDPLGFIAPVLIIAKIILKTIWTIKLLRQDDSSTSLEWDEQLPPQLHKKWHRFITTLPTLPCVKIPRWIQYESTKIESLQLHTFCDGSLHAYAAAAYLRVKLTDDRVYIHLITAKTKITPTKALTVPRIELCGAVLAAELADWIQRSFYIPNTTLQSYFWTDAAIVLYWINGDPNRWQTWVSNRVTKIKNLSTITQWNHVDTTQNPADCATRGLIPTCLATFELWWSGPEWLKHENAMWPKLELYKINIDESLTERKQRSITVNVSIPQNAFLHQYSSITKTVRVCARIWRFIDNARSTKVMRKCGPLSVFELQLATEMVIKLAQQEVFSLELASIKNGQALPHKSKLRSLSPFMDDRQLLRVRGRIQCATLPFNRKHPIILPSHHHFTELLIKNAHLSTLHGNIQLTSAYLRQKYWIVNTRRTVKREIRKCITCFRNNPKIATQLMGNLPYHRVNPPIRPFLATGIDYTGAITLKASRFRGATTYKGYIAIFICLATKCVHLEAVTGMSTELFLMALHRFIGRRGICKDIFSDNGTNFVGADKLIQMNNTTFVQAIEDHVMPKLADKGIQWHFIPPHSPNFGGLWEANVKSVKYHLKRVCTNTLTYEELSTLLVSIESCLNSRPLCPLTADPNDLMILTPAHFLIGDYLLSAPDVAVSDPISLSQHFKQIQRLSRQFWKYWSSDWLSHLQHRPKWHESQPSLQIGDLVILKEDNLPPNQWRMGRVLDIHPGKDNLVRVVTVRTSHGKFKRCISKLCPLPIPRENKS